MKKLLIVLAFTLLMPLQGQVPLPGSGSGGGGGSSLPGVGSWPVTFTAATAQSTTTAATHGQGTSPVVQCRDSAGVLSDGVVSVNPVSVNGDVVFGAWPSAFTGVCVITGSGPGVAGADSTVPGPTGAATFMPEARTTTSEPLVQADCGKAITFTNVAAIAASTPATPLTSGCTVKLKNIGAGDVTLTPLSGTISGAAFITLSTGEFTDLTSNGTNYEATNVHLTVDSLFSITRSRTSQQIGGGATIVTLAGTQTLTNKDATDSTNSVGPASLKNSCADAGANDTYACSLSPAPAAYVTRGLYTFTANTANTGAATINFNTLGAKTIVKVAGGITTALADNDIRVGQVVLLQYDGTNMQMQSTLGNAPASGITSLEGQTGATQTFTDDANVTIVSGSNAHVITWAGQLSVARGGTGLASGTSGGILGYTASGTLASSAAGTAGALMAWGGAGATPGEIDNTSEPNAGEIRFGTTANASATRCVVTVGTAAIGSGSANGNYLCGNLPSGSTANIMQFELNGVDRFVVASDGATTLAAGITATALSITSGTSTLNQIQITSTNSYIWSTRSRMLSPADGVIEFTNNATADFNRLQLGGTTSSFPALKRNAAILEARLADDSAAGTFQGKFNSSDGTAGVTGATCTAWKDGLCVTP